MRFLWHRVTKSKQVQLSVLNEMQCHQNLSAFLKKHLIKTSFQDGPRIHHQFPSNGIIFYCKLAHKIEQLVHTLCLLKAKFFREQSNF